MALEQPSFAEDYRALGVLGLASVHDGVGLATTRTILDGASPYLISFGLHPQLPVMDEADTLSGLAARGELAAIGECGFDFFGDSPDRIRTPDNEKNQRAVFEFQLELAGQRDLPLVLHFRKANDLLFSYARRMSRLPAVIIHSWPGPANEAMDFLHRCPRAKFSFGTGVLNGNKKSRSSAAALPATAILVETDAPFQPPRASPEPGAPLTRAYSTFTDLPRIISGIAGLRGITPEALSEQVNENFMEVFGNALR